jgi:hypothetical protein
MNPDIKARWVAALRSGDYKQGTGVLHKADAYCCLGVLCDLHIKEFGGAWERMEYAEEHAYMDHSALLPPAVCDWAGISGEDDETRRNPCAQSYKPLSSQNDSGSTFPKIADLIEKHL